MRRLNLRKLLQINKLKTPPNRYRTSNSNSSNSNHEHEKLFPVLGEIEPTTFEHITGYSLKRWGFTFWLLTTIFNTVIFCLLAKPKYAENGKEIKDEFSHLHKIPQYFKRAYSRFLYYKDILKEPTIHKLLPDLVEIPHIVRPKYTLVLAFEDVLTHKEWRKNVGWKYKKRPGLDHFLRAVSNTYEIIIFTKVSGVKVFPILNQLDPKKFIQYTLTNNLMDYHGGELFRDLKKLNRDLSKTIFIDCTKDYILNHFENVLEIPKWNGNIDDLALIHLSSFLLSISHKKIEDVRTVISYYSQFPDPLAVFRERQKELIDVADVTGVDMTSDDASDPLITGDYGWLRFD